MGGRRRHFCMLVVKACKRQAGRVSALFFLFHHRCMGGEGENLRERTGFKKNTLYKCFSNYFTSFWQNNSNKWFMDYKKRRNLRYMEKTRFSVRFGVVAFLPPCLLCLPVHTWAALVPRPSVCFCFPGKTDRSIQIWNRDFDRASKQILNNVGLGG